MRSEPRPPAASPESTNKGVKDSVDEIEAPTSSVQTETQLSTSPTAANQASAITRHPFQLEDDDCGADGAVPSDLSLFRSEAEASDIRREPCVRVMPAGIKTAKSELVALADLRGQPRQTEMVVKQLVGEAAAFKTELDQLREFVVWLTGKYSIEEARRAAEERSAAAATSESVALADLRGQLRETEIAVKQSVDEVGAFKAELDRLREVAVRLAGQYSQIKEATDAAEKRSATALEIVNAIETRLGPLAVLRDLSTSTDAHLAAHNALGDQVARKAETSEGQKDNIDYGLIRMQKAPRLIRHHGAVIGGLGVLVLTTFIVTRSVGDADQIGGQPVVLYAQPVLATSALVLPEMMLSTALPILPQTILTTKTTTAQPLLKAPPPVDAQSPQIPMRGTLEVQSDPAGAAVFVNRQRVGETPLQWPQLRAGWHVIWIEREGYQRWTAAAHVEADTITRVDVKLQPKPAGIQ
jgi:hypothetical protein